MSIAMRMAETVWEGTLAAGSGTLSGTSGALDGLPVTWAARTEEPGGKTSPEELAAAAHSSCFSMALALTLSEHKVTPKKLTVGSTVTLDAVDGKPTIVSAASPSWEMFPELTTRSSSRWFRRPQQCAQSHDSSPAPQLLWMQRSSPSDVAEFTAPARTFRRLMARDFRGFHSGFHSGIRVAFAPGSSRLSPRDSRGLHPRIFAASTQAFSRLLPRHLRGYRAMVEAWLLNRSN